jgi:adenylate cyclase
MARKSGLKRAGRRRRRGVLLLGAALTAIVVALALDATGGLHRLELNSIDARFSIRGTQPQPSDVVVVGIDAATLQKTERFPFSRTYHAEVIDKLRKEHAKLIAYDVQFTERTTDAADNALVDAVYKARPRVVLATTEVDARGNSGVFGGDDVVREVGARVGNAIIPGDPGGVLRRLPYSYDGLKSFSVVAAEAAGTPVDRSKFRDDSAWIDYHGGPRTLEVISMADVLNDNFRSGAFTGKVVVIGATAPSLQDVKPTTTSGNGVMSGPEIQAEAISTLLRGVPVRDLPGWVGLALLALFACVAPRLSSLLSARRAFAVTLAVGAAWAVAAQVAFNQSGWLLPVAEPLTGLVLSAVLTLAVLLTVETFERRRTRDFFARFVPESVVNQVVDQTDEDLRLGGVRAVCTVLFSDLRSFTSYGERTPPEQVIEVLNDYLGEMSDAILDHGGTLVAYMGDGIMAVFGAPLPQADHADRALGAAREMLERLEDFNARMVARGEGQGFQMGIGINTGPVMSGNVGSERRLEYTAIGDAVNTASRIESMTKGTPFQVFVADSTRSALVAGPPDDIILVDDFEVRGREQKIRLWGLVEPGMAPEGPTRARPERPAGVAPAPASDA